MLLDPTRSAGLKYLSDFAPKAGRNYASRRNFDVEGHGDVSRLSPYIRHRLVTETEVLQAVCTRHSPQAAEKFIQEVFWRTYWKGWLEMRPSVWQSYQIDLRSCINRLQTEAGMRHSFEAACTGDTGIGCFDHWARELTETGYLHNHARMWFASIWIFTLRLPWQLGADFFMRHLLDGDPASNTLSWRWVAGLQTQGKTYLARPDNIAKFTEGRFRPSADELASFAAPLDYVAPPERSPIPMGGTPARDVPTGFLVHEDDLGLSHFFENGFAVDHSMCVQSSQNRSPLVVSENVNKFVEAAMRDTVDRFKEKLGEVSHANDVDEIVAWAKHHKLAQIVTPYAPAGPVAGLLDALERDLAPNNIQLIRVMRSYDQTAWPYATAGFFKFKDKIPKLLEKLVI